MSEFLDSKGILKDANERVRLLHRGHRWDEDPTYAPVIHCLVQSICDHLNRALEELRKQVLK